MKGPKPAFFSNLNDIEIRMSYQINKKAAPAMIKQVFTFTNICLISLNLFAEPTDKEIADILEYSKNIKQSLLQEELSNIKAFLSKEKTIELLFTRQKLNKLYEDTWTQNEIVDNSAWHSDVFDHLRMSDINNYNRSSLKGRNFILSSKDLFPSYLVKIPRHHLSQDNSNPFYRQNISRIFYNKSINDLIKKYQLKHIYPVRKCLIHVPTQPTILSDQNYALVAEKITCIYKFNERTHIFLELLTQAKSGNFQALGLIAEMVFLIKKVGLWDIDPRNILFVENYKVAFVDTEKWWYEEGDQQFFHNDASELENLSTHGITLLSKILCDVPNLVKTEEDKILQKKADVLTNKLLLFNGNGNLTEELKALLLEN